MIGEGQIKDFTQKLKSEMNKRGDRLFVCESDKYLAASAAVNAVNGDSVAVVVRDSDIADDFAKVFERQSQRVDVIFDCAEIENFAGSKTDREYSACAKSFVKRFPRIVIPMFDRAGKPLFNKVLTDVTGAEGQFLGSATPAKYCVSDFLAECGYECVIVDDVYSAFDFARADEDTVAKNAENPHLYDCMNFMGGWYFTDIPHSHSRLKKLCAGAKKCVLISDVIAKRDISELYAAADILRGGSNVSDGIKNISNFERFVESVCGYFGFEAGRDDATVMILSEINDIPQLKPDSQEKITEYLNTQFRFMTKYDMFAEILRAHALNRFDGKLERIDEILNSVCQTESAVDCFVTMFFRDKLKGEFESAFKETHVCRLSDEDVVDLFGIFESIGFFESYRYDCDMLDTVRIMRDDSGYEAFVENHSSFDEIHGADVDETEFSVTGRGSDLLYECATCARLVTDNVAGKCSFPMLIVARDVKRVVDTMKVLLPDVDCTEDFSTVSNGGSGITVADFDRVAGAARPLEVKTVVFFEMTADPQKMCSVINKTLGRIDTRGIILTRHGNLSGRISAKWNFVAERDHDFALPIGTDEIEYKPNKFASYDAAASKINSVYVTLKSAAVGEYGDCDTLASWLTTLETEYMSDVTLRNDIARKDFGYLSRIGKTYESIFENSVSVGRNGENIKVTGKYDSPASGRKKVLFNTCARLLSRSCKGIDVDCKTCPERELFEMNNFGAFAECVENFFTETEDYAHDRDIERQRELDKGIIHSEGDNNIKELTVKAVKEAYDNWCELFGKTFNDVYPHVNIYEACEHLALDGEGIMAIRNTVTGVYALALERYHNRIVEIFDSVSDKVKVRYETLLDRR